MGFERCHPAVNLIYFAAVLVGMITFQHPVFLVISFLCAYAYSVKRNGWKAVVFNLCLLPFVVAFALYYSSYTHFGMTVLHQNMVGNNMTLESLMRIPPFSSTRLPPCGMIRSTDANLMFSPPFPARSLSSSSTCPSITISFPLI